MTDLFHGEVRRDYVRQLDRGDSHHDQSAHVDAYLAEVELFRFDQRIKAERPRELFVALDCFIPEIVLGKESRALVDNVCMLGLRVVDLSPRLLLRLRG